MVTGVLPVEEELNALIELNAINETNESLPGSSPIYEAGAAALRATPAATAQSSMSSLRFSNR